LRETVFCIDEVGFRSAAIEEKSFVAVKSRGIAFSWTPRRPAEAEGGHFVIGMFDQRRMGSCAWRSDLVAQRHVPERRQEVRRTGAREGFSRLRNLLSGYNEQKGGKEETGVGDGGAVLLHAVDDQLICARCLGEALGHGLARYGPIPHSNQDKLLSNTNKPCSTT
jgi:hypothetical protein